jgi:hypothetical protein
MKALSLSKTRYSLCVDHASDPTIGRDPREDHSLSRENELE